MPRILAFLMALSLLAGCGLLPEQIDETKNWSASKLYYSAKEALSEGNYERAIKLFENLEARYPYGAYAQQAQLEVAYAYYKDNEPASAIAACERFIKLHPTIPTWITPTTCAVWPISSRTRASSPASATRT